MHRGYIVWCGVTGRVWFGLIPLLCNLAFLSSASRHLVPQHFRTQTFRTLGVSITLTLTLTLTPNSNTLTLR